MKANRRSQKYITLTTPYDEHPGNPTLKRECGVYKGSHYFSYFDLKPWIETVLTSTQDLCLENKVNIINYHLINSNSRSMKCCIIIII